MRSLAPAQARDAALQDTMGEQPRRALQNMAGEQACRGPQLLHAHRGASRLIAALALCAMNGCHSKQEAPPAPTTVASALPPKPPVDQTLPGELAEGTEKAFGLPIPRRMRTKLRFPDEVLAVGEIAPEQLANYVRSRVLATNIETGPAKTVFTRATVKSAPMRMLRIEVIARSSMAELFVRDETRPPVEEGLSVEERWRRKGFTPDGKPLDPTHLE